jgi:hypothetical protein
MPSSVSNRAIAIIAILATALLTQTTPAFAAALPPASASALSASHACGAAPAVAAPGRSRPAAVSQLKAKSVPGVRADQAAGCLGYHASPGHRQRGLSPGTAGRSRPGGPGPHRCPRHLLRQHPARHRFPVHDSVCQRSRYLHADPDQHD